MSELLEKRRITVILGPRQCGKTTLARDYVRPDSENYFDLENPVDQVRLEADPMGLARLTGVVVIDEVQRNPGLFPVLRVLADRDPAPARFLLLGSSSPDLRNHVSETLAGRAGFVDLHGFDCSEVGWDVADRLWLRGGFPESFLSRSDADSFDWREDFVRTFLERDIPQFGLRVPASRLRRFWTLVAHQQGGIWNSSALGKALGASHTTARDYLEILEQTYMLRTLQPYAINIKKRLVKSPKVYFRDTGILHGLLRIKSLHDLETNPVVGMSWEGFAIEQVLQVMRVRSRDAFFWRTQSGAELDLVVQRSTGLIGFEFKRSSAPSTTHSMRTTMGDLNLEHLFVIYPGEKKYQLDDRITALPLKHLSTLASLEPKA